LSRSSVYLLDTELRAESSLHAGFFNGITCTA